MTDAASWPVIGPGSLLQGTIAADRRWRSLLRVRRLEAVVLGVDGCTLRHYHRDQTRPDRPWVAGEIVTEQAIGPGQIAQETGTFGRPGRLHVLVPEVDGPAHYVESSGRRWERTETPWGFPAPRGGFSGPARDLVAVAVAETALSGLHLIGELASALPGGDGGLVWPSPAPGGRGWQQALVQEGASVYQWHRQTWRGRVRWVRAACLRFDPGDDVMADAGQSTKLAQVTGERDTQPGASDATLSFSESRSGVRGTDLGVRVDHAGRSFLLFGDSHWTTPGRVTRDAMGEVSDTGPRDGLPGVELHGAPLRIVGGPATSREYDVPLDAFSLDGELLMFFSSHHFARHQVMGRSLLTRAVDPALRISGRERRRPIDCRLVGTFSDRFFVNVSLARRRDVLYVWGSGSYRADDLRLAAFDLSSSVLRDALLGRRRWARPQEGVRYFSGVDAHGAPRWSLNEDAAAPVLPGAFGELSVRWSDAARRYLLLAMEGPEDPIGRAVTLRAASEPWGPWTPRRRLFDWEVHGKSAHDEASRFIRVDHDGDPVGDAIFAQQRSSTGAAYAPYLFDSWNEGDDLVLRYTLSTWNPYQVVLMQHRVAGWTGRAP